MSLSEKEDTTLGIGWLPRAIANTIAASTLLFLIGPFGSLPELQRMADENANSALNRLLYEPENQDKIAVILLDDDAYEYPGFKDKWPLPRENWQRAAKILACAGAKAIYFDILFGDLMADEKQAQILTNIDKQFWNQGNASFEYCIKEKLVKASSQVPSQVPVYFAFTGNPEDWLPKDTNHKVVAQWGQKGSSYPLSILVEKKPVDTPGLALAQHIKPALSQTLKDSTARLFPLWTQRRPINQYKWKKDPERICLFANDSITPSPLKDVWAWWQWVIEWLPGNNPNIQSTQCPPFLTINLSQLINYDRSSLKNLNAPDTGVRDRIVIVGQSYKGVENYIPAPMHKPQQLASVYLHATVAENLLTLEKQFRQIGSYDWTLVLILATMVSFTEAWLKVRGVFIHTCKYCWALAAFCILILTCLCFHHFLHWPYGLLPTAAFKFTSTLAFVKVFSEKGIYDWANRVLDYLIRLWKRYISS